MDSFKDADRNTDSDDNHNGTSRVKRSGKGSYKDVGVKALYHEGDLKKASNPCVSMTFVGETVTVTQHFHF